MPSVKHPTPHRLGALSSMIGANSDQISRSTRLLRHDGSPIT